MIPRGLKRRRFKGLYAQKQWTEFAYGEGKAYRGLGVTTHREPPR